MPLTLTPNLAAPDDVLQALTDLHEGLSLEQSARASARLALILINHIGDAEIAHAAIAAARASGRPDG